MIVISRACRAVTAVVLALVVARFAFAQCGGSAAELDFSWTVHWPATAMSSGDVPIGADDLVRFEVSLPGGIVGSDVAAYRWDWDNDGVFDASGREIDHHFSTSGDTAVTLEVTLVDRSCLRTTRVVRVTERLPLVYGLFLGSSVFFGYEASPLSSCIALYVQSAARYEAGYHLRFLNKRDFNTIWEPESWGRPGSAGLAWAGDLAAIPYVSQLSPSLLVIADLRTQTLLHEIEYAWESDLPPEAAVSPDGHLVAITANEEGEPILLVSVPSGLVEHNLRRSFRGPIFFNPSGTLLIAGGHYGIEMWDTMTWTALPALPGSEDSYGGGIAISPDGLRMAIGTWDRGAILVDLRTGELLGELGEKHRIVSCLKWSKGGRFLALATENYSAEVISVETGKVVATVVSPNGGDCTSLAFSSDGKRLAIVFGPLLAVYDLPEGLRELP